MTNDQIKEIALANGFKPKEQLYDFARALIDEYEHLKMDWVVQPLSEVDDD